MRKGELTKIEGKVTLEAIQNIGLRNVLLITKSEDKILLNKYFILEPMEGSRQNANND